MNESETIEKLRKIILNRYEDGEQISKNDVLEAFGFDPKQVFNERDQVTREMRERYAN